MDRYFQVEYDFSEVKEHLFSGISIKYMSITAPVFLVFVNLAGFLKIIDEIPQILLVSGQALVFPLLAGLFLQDITDQ